MYLKVIIFLIIFGVLPNSYATDLVIAENGKSDYRIIIAPNNNKGLAYFNKMAGNLLKNCLKQVSGVNLPVVIGRDTGKTPAIYIGGNPVAEKAGIKVKSLKGWEYVIKSDGKNLFLAGHDAPCLPGEKSRIYTRYYLGTLKAVTEFLKQYCGARFVFPGNSGITVVKKSRVTVPADLSIHESPSFQYCCGRTAGILYDIANNFFAAVDYGTNGGHSHNVAIPPKKYFKVHPEYFALINGKRYAHSTRPQYCISNPDVQKLIYQELLHHADQGYNWVQLGQSDGFIPCECEKCRNMYGIKSKAGGYKGRNDPTWGEKLWIMHLNLAKRFAKDRPGKKLVIMAYGPTANPPSSIKKFPDNVLVELTRYTPEYFAKWRKLTVPGGFVTYIYNWGYYQFEGFTPKVTPEFCKTQLKLFKTNNVKGIYRCGFGELFGLEGPVYYVYGCLLGNPDANPEKLVVDYCKAAFGNAAAAMLKFYNLLHTRIALQTDSEKADWNDAELLAGAKNLRQKNMRLLLLRYPQMVVRQLDKYLSQAEKEAVESNVKLRLKMVRLELDYLKYTALLSELFIKYIHHPSLPILQELNLAVKKRNAFINSLPKDKNGNIGKIGSFTVYSHVPVQTLLAGGLLNAPLKGPFQWDFDFYLKHGIVPGARLIKVPFSRETIIVDGKADEPVWRKTVPQFLVRQYMDKKTVMPFTTVQAAYDKNSFYVLATYKHVTPQKLKQEGLYVFLGNHQDKTNTFEFPATLGRKNTDCYKCRPGSGIDGTDTYKPLRKTGGQVCVTGNPENGTYTIEMKIPFAIFGKPARKGDVWFGNFVRRWWNGNKRFKDFIWEPNILLNTWRDRYQVMGKIVFE